MDGAYQAHAWVEHAKSVFVAYVTVPFPGFPVPNLELRVKPPVGELCC